MQVFKEEKKKSLINLTKSWLLLGRKDFTMRDVAISTEMTIGVLYQYYDGRDKLLQACMSEKPSAFTSALFISNNQSDFVICCMLAPVPMLKALSSFLNPSDNKLTRLELISFISSAWSYRLSCQIDRKLKILQYRSYFGLNK